MSDPLISMPSVATLQVGAADAREPVRGKNANDAAKQFEALMLNQLMKTMRATIPTEDDEYGFGMQMADEMFDQAISDAAAGGLGLSKILEREFGGNSEEKHAVLRLGSAPMGGMSAAPPVANDARGRSRTGTLGHGNPRPGIGPADGQISSRFGWREHPIHKTRKFHEGLDIAAPQGTEIRAVQSGTVSFAGRRGGYGNTVEIRHADGTTTRYAHASRLHVRSGDHVEVGESVADVGSSGQATGPHLHFEARENGKAMDPEAYLRRLRGKNARWHGK